MKATTAILLAMTAVAHSAERNDWTAWQWESAVEVGHDGMMRLDVPPAVLDVSRPDLADLRLLAPDGAETPFCIEQPVHREGGLRNAEGFKVRLEGAATIIEVNAHAAGSIDGAELVSPAREFIKSVSIEGQDGSGVWLKLAANEVVFRQTDGAERLRVPFSAGVWESLRFTIQDDRSQPVPFTGIRFQVKGVKPGIVEFPLKPGAREERSGETRLTLDLGARNIIVAGIRFQISDAVFSRDCSLEFQAMAADGTMRMNDSGRVMIYRVAGDHGVTAEHMMIPVHRRIPSRLVVAVFRNGDSPPLDITGVSVACEPTVLGFHASKTGIYQLLTGNRNASRPDHDLASLRGALAASGVRPFSPGALRERADFKTPPALPGVEPAGARIDLSDWTFQRGLDALIPGVIRVELDEKILAGCRNDLGDLRLVQHDRQIPYLVKPRRELRDLRASISLLPQDPKRPTVSQWEVGLPVDGLPMIDLTAHTPARMFSRHFEALADRKDDLGNTWSDKLGAAEWVNSQGHEKPLVLEFHGMRMPMKFRLQTDHGDNPPIMLENPLVRYEAPVIVAKVADDAPIFLAYGNPKATAPEYDLRLVRSELMAAEARPARLLEEERLHPGKRGGTIGTENGSPWLWLALGGVVVVLLAVVAKLLPKPSGH